MNRKKIKISEDRWEFIKHYLEGKIVLDVGCAELITTTEDPTKRSRWPLDKIKKIAKYVLGTDINKEQVENLRKLGYNVILADAEKDNLHQKFDVILAGELIEHLSNPGLFLENMKRHLKEDGILIITTPNRFDFLTFLRALITNKIPGYTKDIAKHVFYFDINSLKALVERHNFQVIDHSYYWTYGSNYDSFKRKFFLKFFTSLRPQFVRGIMVALKKNKYEL